jgi:KDO2-lipid IV(A) lauroyltransferase
MLGLTDVKHRVQYGLFRGALALFRLLPLDWAVRLCGRVWLVIGPRSRRHARALSNLKQAFPEMSAAERESIARAMWENMGRVVAETMLLDRILAEPDRMEVVNQAGVVRLMRRPDPQIGVTLHMGNWELAAYGCAACGGKPAGVYRQLENPYVDRTLRSHRAHLYTGGMFTKGSVHDKGPGGQSTARRMTDLVRQGGNLAFVIDQVDRRGIAVPFFGGEAKFTPVPSMIARHVGARIWMARSLRVGKGTKFRAELTELEVKRTKNQQEDVRAATAAIFRQFEAWIREAPEQWLWFNTRFEAAPLETEVAASDAPVAAPSTYSLNALLFAMHYAVLA